jgi:hypothetical protein
MKLDEGHGEGAFWGRALQHREENARIMARRGTPIVRLIQNKGHSKNTIIVPTPSQDDYCNVVRLRVC